MMLRPTRSIAPWVLGFRSRDKSGESLEHEWQKLDASAD